MARRIVPFALAALLCFVLFASAAVAGVIDNGEVGEGAGVESIDSVKSSDGEIATESPTFLFVPRVASVQVDLLKLLGSLDLYGNVTFDLFRIGRTRFGTQFAAYSHGDFCFDVVGHASCDDYGRASHTDLLAHASWHFPDAVTTNANVRLSAVAGAGYVDGYESEETQFDRREVRVERWVPKLGAALQLRLVDWLTLTLTLDYTMAIGWPESTAKYIPLGLRIGYTGW